MSGHAYPSDNFILLYISGMLSNQNRDRAQQGRASSLSFPCRLFTLSKGCFLSTSLLCFTFPPKEYGQSFSFPRILFTFYIGCFLSTSLLYFTLLHTIFFFLVFSLLSLSCFLSTSDFSLGFSTFISLLSLSPIRSAMLLSLQYNKMLNSSPFFPSHFSFLFGCCPFFSLKTILSLLFLPRICHVKTKKA